MSKKKQSHDQKRKAKLAKRAERRPPEVDLAYEGSKYRADEWTEAVFATELGVYEAYVTLDRKLTNQQAKEAFTELITDLRDGMSPLLDAKEEDAEELDHPVDFLIWNIRRSWTQFVEDESPLATKDMIGILRTLLYSIKAHAWNTGPSTGYLSFLEGFMKRGGVRVDKVSRRVDDEAWPKLGQRSP